MLFGAGGASAQELTHRFINPSFGGNPFYSDHLLGIANIHRPKQPEAPSDPPPTEEELIASQIRARLLSQLSSDVLDRIEAAKPGETGQFEFGDQRISFTRTQTETQVTFLNTRTGETQRLVIPAARTGGVFSGTLGTGAPSAEQALGALGTLPGGGSSLFPIPLGNN
jgi:curli production assembly/transport component CsgF